MERYLVYDPTHNSLMWYHHFEDAKTLAQNVRGSYIFYEVEAPRDDMTFIMKYWFEEYDYMNDEDVIDYYHGLSDSENTEYFVTEYLKKNNIPFYSVFRILE